MAVLITTIILIFSLFGIGVILFRKIPVLVELPEVIEKPKEEKFISKLKEKIKGLSIIKSFSSEIILQKILSKVRILTLKADNKTFNWIQKLREKYKKKKIKENDNYWSNLKDSIDKGKKL